LLSLRPRTSWLGSPGPCCRLEKNIGLIMARRTHSTQTGRIILRRPLFPLAFPCSRAADHTFPGTDHYYGCRSLPLSRHIGTYVSATITDELTQSPKDRYRAGRCNIHSTHSIRPESLHWINRSRPARWDKSSHYGTNRQEQNCAKKCEWIVGFHFVEKASHEMAGN
jgi:hypothetical protein